MHRQIFPYLLADQTNPLEESTHSSKSRPHSNRYKSIFFAEIVEIIVLIEDNNTGHWYGILVIALSLYPCVSKYSFANSNDRRDTRRRASGRRYRTLPLLSRAPLYF